MSDTKTLKKDWLFFGSLHLLRMLQQLVGNTMIKYVYKCDMACMLKLGRAHLTPSFELLYANHSYDRPTEHGAGRWFIELNFQGRTSKEKI